MCVLFLLVDLKRCWKVTSSKLNEVNESKKYYKKLEINISLVYYNAGQKLLAQLRKTVLFW